LERGLQLAREGGLSALLTMRNWMFIKQFSALREWLLATYDLRLLGDVDRGAFEEVPDEVVSAVMSLFRKSAVSDAPSIAMQPTPLDDKSRDGERTKRKRAAVLCQVGRFEFGVASASKIPNAPIIYWWDYSQVVAYSEAAKLGEIAPVRQGLGTRNDVRFIRSAWEIRRADLLVERRDLSVTDARSRWVPLVKGASGRVWIEPLVDVVAWDRSALALKVWIEFYRQRAPGQYFKNAHFYFRRGIAFSMIGADFDARYHRFASVFGEKGSSVFVDHPASLLCYLNSRAAYDVMTALNPSVCFQVGDVARLPWQVVDGAESVFSQLEEVFAESESHREPSVEFRLPGGSRWRAAQAWAIDVVDRGNEAALKFEAPYETEQPSDHVSFGVGVALGRLGVDGDGVLHVAPSASLPHGLLYISVANDNDSLEHTSCALLRRAFEARGSQLDSRRSLREYLAQRFFPDVHRKMYENRPIYLPLSSKNKSFVAYVSIHRWTIDSLRALLAEHLYPEKQRLEGEKNDLRQARQSADKRAVREAEKRFTQVDKWLDELDAFIKLVEQCAEKGPPPTDGKCKPRDRDARYEMELDDGVMINAAALWPLLEPQWKDPAKWWKELANAEGKKDYDWSHLAARYFPDRVDGKCRVDPSLAVAHGCFWKYHPAKAYQWELRLQDEIGPDFKLDEPARDAEQAYTPAWVQLSSDAYRAAFEAAHPDKVEALVAAEQKRREKKRKMGAESEDEEQGELELEESGEDDA
jgi:hypothetical protein